METQLNPLIASSADPTEVSNTVKGLIVGASSAIIFGAALLFHITLTPDSIVALASDMGMLVGTGWFIYGLLHKGVRYLGSMHYDNRNPIKVEPLD